MSHEFFTLLLLLFLVNIGEHIHLLLILKHHRSPCFFLTSLTTPLAGVTHL